MDSSPWVEYKAVVERLIHKLQELREEVDSKALETDHIFIKGITYSNRRVTLRQAWFDTKEFEMVRHRDLSKSFQLCQWTWNDEGGTPTPLLDVTIDYPYELPPALLNVVADSTATIKPKVKRLSRRLSYDSESSSDDGNTSSVTPSSGSFQSSKRQCTRDVSIASSGVRKRSAKIVSHVREVIKELASECTPGNITSSGVRKRSAKIVSHVQEVIKKLASECTPGNEDAIDYEVRKMLAAPSIRKEEQMRVSSFLIEHFKKAVELSSGFDNFSNSEAGVIMRAITTSVGVTGGPSIKAISKALQLSYYAMLRAYNCKKHLLDEMIEAAKREVRSILDDLPEDLVDIEDISERIARGEIDIESFVELLTVNVLDEEERDLLRRGMDINEPLHVDEEDTLLDELDEESDAPDYDSDEAKASRAAELRQKYEQLQKVLLNCKIVHVARVLDSRHTRVDEFDCGGEIQRYLHEVTSEDTLRKGILVRSFSKDSSSIDIHPARVKVKTMKEYYHDYLQSTQFKDYVERSKWTGSDKVVRSHVELSFAVFSRYFCPCIIEDPSMKSYVSDQTVEMKGIIDAYRALRQTRTAQEGSRKCSHIPERNRIGGAEAMDFSSVYSVLNAVLCDKVEVPSVPFPQSSSVEEAANAWQQGKDVVSRCYFEHSVVTKEELKRETSLERNSPQRFEMHQWECCKGFCTHCVLETKLQELICPTCEYDQEAEFEVVYKAGTATMYNEKHNVFMKGADLLPHLVKCIKAWRDHYFDASWEAHNRHRRFLVTASNVLFVMVDNITNLEIISKDNFYNVAVQQLVVYAAIRVTTADGSHMNGIGYHMWSGTEHIDQNAHSVFKCYDVIFNDLRERGYFFHAVYVHSDGCKELFKCRKYVQRVGEAPVRYGLDFFSHVYAPTNEFKSGIDAQVGDTKRFLKRMSNLGLPLNYPVDPFTFCAMFMRQPSRKDDPNNVNYSIAERYHFFLAGLDEYDEVYARAKDHLEAPPEVLNRIIKLDTKDAIDSVPVNLRQKDSQGSSVTFSSVYCVEAFNPAFKPDGHHVFSKIVDLNSNFDSEVKSVVVRIRRYSCSCDSCMSPHRVNTWCEDCPNKSFAGVFERVELKRMKAANPTIRGKQKNLIKQYKAEDIVEVKFTTRAQGEMHWWFPATITAEEGKNAYTVRFEDGIVSGGVEADHIREFEEYKVGDHVMVNYMMTPDLNRYYRGYIMSIDLHKKKMVEGQPAIYRIMYDDGVVAWVPRRYLARGDSPVTPFYDTMQKPPSKRNIFEPAVGLPSTRQKVSEPPPLPASWIPKEGEMIEVYQKKADNAGWMEAQLGTVVSYDESSASCKIQWIQDAGGSKKRIRAESLTTFSLQDIRPQEKRRRRL